MVQVGVLVRMNAKPAAYCNKATNTNAKTQLHPPNTKNKLSPRQKEVAGVRFAVDVAAGVERSSCSSELSKRRRRKSRVDIDD